MEETKATGNYLIKFSVSFSMIIVLFIFFNCLFFSKNLGISLTGIRGNVLVKTNEKDIYKKAIDLSGLKQNFYVKTDKESSALLNAGKGYGVNINENSELRILKAEKLKNDEDCYLYLLNGSAEFSVKLPSQNSNFEVQSDMLKFSVRGTKFNVKISEEKNTSLNVTEGKVYVKMKNSKEIIDFENSLNEDNTDKIEDFFNYEIEIDKGQKLEVKYKDFLDANTEKLEIINSIKNEIEENPDYIIEDESIEKLRIINQGTYIVSKID